MEKTLYTKQSKTLIMIPVYNGEKFISKTLDSCLSQTLPTEIWVVDNCSTDETLNIVTKYTKENADVKLIVNNENYGRVGNMNRCLDLFISSQYEYIKFIFCGDELLEDSIELVEKIFLSNDDLSMVNGCYVFNGKNHSSIGSNPFSKNRRVEIQELIEKGVYPSSATGTFNSLTYSKKGIGEYRFNPLFLGISMFHNDILYTNGDIYYTNEVVGIFNVEAHASFHKQFDYFSDHFQNSANVFLLDHLQQWGLQ